MPQFVSNWYNGATPDEQRPLNENDAENGEAGYHTPPQGNTPRSSLGSIDANHDGVITPQEARNYVERSIASRIRSVAGQTPNTAFGAASNVVLGGALVTTAHYIPDGYVSDDTKNMMQTGGFAMMSTGMAVFTGMLAKKFVSKPAEPQNNSPDTRPDINRRA